MNLLARVAQRMHGLARYLEEPDLLAHRRLGINLPIYRKLKQPWLRDRRPTTILDIGANIGQFAQAAHAAFPEARIYSFEPLPDCYEQLLARLKGVPEFSAFNLGLGDRSGNLDFQRNAFSPSSSFLPMTSTHTDEFPHTTESKPVRIQMERLDDAVAGLQLAEPLLIKIDVQGYEDKVIAGGEQTIRRADLLIVESSFEPLYEGQPLFEDILRLLVSHGFAYRGALDQTTSPKDGRPLQADGIFVRKTGASHR